MSEKYVTFSDAVNVYNKTRHIPTNTSPEELPKATKEAISQAISEWEEREKSKDPDLLDFMLDDNPRLLAAVTKILSDNTYIDKNVPEELAYGVLYVVYKSLKLSLPKSTNLVEDFAKLGHVAFNQERRASEEPYLQDS